DWLEQTGRMQDTMIVLTSEHGDFLGDHWMGEKQFFQDTSIRIPLIIYDPSADADATRGTVCDALVESIDLAPTFLDVAGGEAADHILEGRSLMPILHGTAADAGRDFAICEYDYSWTPLAAKMGVPVKEAVMFCVVTKDWKLVHYEVGFRPTLFDLKNDPDELVDLGESPDHADVLDRMYEHLFRWARRQHARTTRSEPQLVEMRTKSRGKGITLGLYDETDTDLELTVKYRGRTAEDKRE
ncbi:MAG: sulfatase/phosphatase domain-containing protein, partial [Pseudomonadota bacterium]